MEFYQFVCRVHFIAYMYLRFYATVKLYNKLVGYWIALDNEAKRQRCYQFYPFWHSQVNFWGLWNSKKY